MNRPPPHPWAPGPESEEELLMQIDRRRRIRAEARRHPVLGIMTLNLTPMIDCIFLLLIHLILTIDFRPAESSLTMDMAQAVRAAELIDQDPFQLPERPVQIVVRSTGLGREEYAIVTDEPSLRRATPQTLRTLAAEARNIDLPSEVRFIVAPEPGTRWEHALAASSALQRAGFARVSLARGGSR